MYFTVSVSAEYQIHSDQLLIALEGRTMWLFTHFDVHLLIYVVPVAVIYVVIQVKN